MKLKPVSKIISKNNYRRFDPIYKCYFPKCGRVLSGKHEEKCKCGQEIDWCEWR